MNKTDTQNAVLIVGGYGIVGEQIAKLLRQRHADMPLMIAGRNRKKAEHLATSLGSAEAIVLDVQQPKQITPLKEKLAAVVTATNDPSNHILVDTIRNDLPYIDITRWTARLREGVIQAATERLTQPVIFSSAWMAGVAALVARKATEEYSAIDSIDIDILYSLKDKAGPNSVEYVDQLGTPFDVFEDGKIISVMPMTNPKRVNFPSGFSTNTYRFDTPDQLTLPLICDAKSVSARIAYDDKSSASFLSFLVRSGLWHVINRPRFTKIRHSLLYNPGEGGPHEMVISLKGIGKDGSAKESSASLVDSQGQTHLTALGAVIQIERALGLNGNTAAAAGINFPERHENIDIALNTLKDQGVAVTFNR